MSDDLKVFKPKISNIDSVNNTLNFVLSGDNEYGLDKSLVNAIRRILLTDIPTIGFNLTETGENSDLIMVTNNSSLHNEMLSHRIALIPLYLKPENYMKNHLFECKIKHDTIEPFKFITMNDVNIYPLKSGFLERLDHYFDESYDMSHEDSKILKEQLNIVNIENYDLKKPFSQKEKDKIFHPFEFRGNFHYSMITELKSTNTEDIHQEIHFYGSPSVGYGYQDAKFQAVSQATYSFEIDEQLVNSVLKEKIQIEGIEKEDQQDYERKFRLAESERYFYRDDYGEPNRYNFAIKSNHYYDSETLFKKSIEILIEKCESLKLELIEYLKENKSKISVDKVKEFIYHYEVLNESHTLGNLIQSHITRKSINDDTIINLFGYKKPHPLEDKILFIVSMNPKHKISKSDEVIRIQNITEFILQCLNEILNDLRILYKVSEKTF